MEARKSRYTQKISAAKTGISERRGRDFEERAILPSQKIKKKWKTHKDPFEDVWEEKLVPMLSE